MTQLHDHDAEIAYLAWAFADNGFLDTHPVAPDDLHGKDNQVVLECMREVHARRQPVDVVSVRREIESHGRLAAAGGDDRLMRLSAYPGNLPTPLSTQPRIRELAVMRTMRDRLRLAVDALDSRQLADALDHVHEVADRARLAGQRRIVTGGEAMVSAVEHFGALKDGAPTRLVPTGLRNLDAKIGGIAGGEWLTIGAGTNVGKSWTILTMALALARQRRRMGIVSLEDPEPRWGTRIAAVLSGVSSSSIRRRQLAGDDHRKLADAVNRAHEAGFELATALGASVHEVIDTIRGLVLDRGCEIVGIDYAQVLHGVDSHTEHAELRRMYSMLRAAAERLDVPLVMLSQVARKEKGGKWRPPTREDLKGGGDLENKSDYIVMMWRAPKKKGEEPRIVAQVDKSKEGGNALRFELVQKANGVLVEDDPVADEEFSDGPAEFADGSPVPQDDDIYTRAQKQIARGKGEAAE